MLIAAAVLFGTVAPTQAASVDGFGKEATKVASVGGCENIRSRSNGGGYAYRGLVCDLRGERINILTFQTKREEKRWLTMTCDYLPKQWVTIGYGWVATARNGNRAAAKTVERVYKGSDAYVCSDVVS